MCCDGRRCQVAGARTTGQERGQQHLSRGPHPGALYWALATPLDSPRPLPPPTQWRLLKMRSPRTWCDRMSCSACLFTSHCLQVHRQTETRPSASNKDSGTSGYHFPGGRSGLKGPGSHQLQSAQPHLGHSTGPFPTDPPSSLACKGAPHRYPNCWSQLNPMTRIQKTTQLRVEETRVPSVRSEDTRQSTPTQTPGTPPGLR